MVRMISVRAFKSPYRKNTSADYGGDDPIVEYDVVPVTFKCAILDTLSATRRRDKNDCDQYCTDFLRHAL
jgi:hypothetical protein